MCNTQMNANSMSYARIQMTSPRRSPENATPAAAHPFLVKEQTLTAMVTVGVVRR